ncbi:gibberellin 2-beta-dioxygenase 3-like [Lolium perenne]|uniref:gibberellin 2-beta-dioxygenase 3-like n=1 Tax=Lolium perenne TaxID=4522 RepID=UPI0021F50243|nr:gibberellin 2-beta-dioxygenase 3-like [Lolium perenne]
MVAIAVPCTIDQIPLVKCPKAANAAVPTIDMSAPGAAAAVAEACRGVGFFRATNHGVPAALTDALESRAGAFFALPHNDKLEHAAARPFGYGSKTIGPNGDVGWLEYLLLSLGSSTIHASSLRPSLRAALEEYTVAVRAVGTRVLELMAEGLGLADRSALRRMVVDATESDEMVRVNHYPACPLASSVTGFGEHTDPQIISVLRSNRTGGLQIMLRDGRWVPVAPDPDSLFVNVGDALQVLTNGRFMSVKHRVVAPEAGKPSRLSVIYFSGPSATQRIAPLPELMRDGEQSLYREFTWGEYKKAAYKTRLGDHRLGPFELHAAKADHHCSSSSSSKAVQPTPPHVARVH